MWENSKVNSLNYLLLQNWIDNKGISNLPFLLTAALVYMCNGKVNPLQEKMADDDFEPMDPTLQNILDAKSLRSVTDFGKFSPFSIFRVGLVIDKFQTPSWPL